MDPLSEQPARPLDGEVDVFAESPGGADTPSRWRRLRAGITPSRVLILLALAVAIVWANTVAIESELVLSSVQRFGYLGIFFAASLSGFNLVVPVPVITFFPLFMESGLRPGPTIGLIAAGMSVGDLLGFTVGRVGRDVFAPAMEASTQRLERLRDTHPHLPVWAMLVYAAIVPLPNELLVIPLAFLRYPVVPVMAAVLAGNLVFNTVMAFWLLELF